MAVQIIKHKKVSIRFACICMGISEGSYYYKPKLQDENEQVAEKLADFIKSLKF